MFPPPRPRNLKIPTEEEPKLLSWSMPEEFPSLTKSRPPALYDSIAKKIALRTLCSNAQMLLWSGPAAAAATWALYNKSHGCQVSRAAEPFISTPEFGRLGTICLEQPESLCGPRTNKRPCDELCPLKHLRDKDADRQSAAYIMRPRLRHAVRHWMKYCTMGHSVVGGRYCLKQRVIGDGEGGRGVLGVHRVVHDKLSASPQGAACL